MEQRTTVARSCVPIIADIVFGRAAVFSTIGTSSMLVPQTSERRAEQCRVWMLLRDRSYLDEKVAMETSNGN